MSKNQVSPPAPGSKHGNASGGEPADVVNVALVGKSVNAYMMLRPGRVEAVLSGATIWAPTREELLEVARLLGRAIRDRAVAKLARRSAPLHLAADVPVALERRLDGMGRMPDHLTRGFFFRRLLSLTVADVVRADTARAGRLLEFEDSVHEAEQPFATDDALDARRLLLRCYALASSPGVRDLVRSRVCRALGLQAEDEAAIAARHGVAVSRLRHRLADDIGALRPHSWRSRRAPRKGAQS